MPAASKLCLITNNKYNLKLTSITNVIERLLNTLTLACHGMFY